MLSNALKQRLRKQRSAEHQQGVILKEGYISRNPGSVQWSHCGQCHRGKRNKGHLDFFEPMLVRMHRSKSGLSLWYCEGCPDILIRLDKRKG